jgi:hypothetical protein
LEVNVEFITKDEELTIFSGATGGFNAHVSAFPSVNWLEFADGFIKKLVFDHF